MRALTVEEVGCVAGGSPFSESERDVGERLQNWGTVVSTLGRIGKIVGPIMIVTGAALVNDANHREGQETGGGGSGGAGEGGHSGDPGGGGGYTDPRGGGDRPQVCYGPGDCHSVGIGNG